MHPAFPDLLKQDPQYFTLNTERLELRLLAQEDVEFRFKTLQQYPEITDLMSFEPPTVIADTQSNFKRQKESFEQSQKIAWSILHKGQLVGTVGLEDITWKLLAREFNKAEIGYWLNPEHHGQGIMTEAVQAVITFSFEKLELNKLHISHASNNTASQRVIQKCGFRLIGEEKRHFRRFNRWHDNKLYELLNPNPQL